jgi:hypothetical protein
LLSTWRNFATSLKHKRHEVSVENLIASLDVEEKARAKDTGSKGGEGHSSANMVQKNHNKDKGKKKSNKPNKTTNFKKKKNKAELTCFACGETSNFAKDCPDRADRRGKKGNVNIVVASNEGDKGYGNLPFIFSVFQSPSWWLDTGANVHVCSDINLFSSYQAARDSSVLMGNGSHASVHGIGTVDLKFTSGKIVQHVPSIHKNLVSGTLCRDGFKVVLESNKIVV